jgi:hypothetical protein
MNAFTGTALACLASPAFLLTVGALLLVLAVMVALVHSAWAARQQSSRPRADDFDDTHANFVAFERSTRPAPERRRVRAGRAHLPALKPSYDGRAHAGTSHPQP